MTTLFSKHYASKHYDGPLVLTKYCAPLKHAHIRRIVALHKDHAQGCSIDQVPFGSLHVPSWDGRPEGSGFNYEPGAGIWIALRPALAQYRRGEWTYWAVELSDDPPRRYAEDNKDSQSVNYWVPTLLIL